MDLVSEGRLCGTVSLKDAFQQIVEGAFAGIVFLRVSFPDDNLSGWMVIKDSQFVTGCGITGSAESGYSALKQLLAPTTGNYSVLKASAQETVGVEQTLYMRLQKLADSLPALPDSFHGFFDEKSLLDTVFAPLEAEPVQPYPQAEVQSPITDSSIKIPELKLSELKCDWREPSLSCESLVVSGTKQPAIRQVLSAKEPRRDIGINTPAPLASTSAFKLSKSYVPSLLPMPSLRVVFLIGVALFVGVVGIFCLSQLKQKPRSHMGTIRKYAKYSNYSRSTDRRRFISQRNSM